MTSRIVFGIVGVLSAATTAPKQSMPVTVLGKPEAEFPEGFASLNGLRELPDGRILTIEQCERVVKLLDLNTGKETQVGRTGSGPGEYRLPVRLFALQGDSAAVQDGGNRRFLMIGPDGKPGEFFAPPPEVRPAIGGRVAAIGFTPLFTDARGRLYGREAGLLEAGINLIRAESVAVERWDRRSGKRDTIAFHRTLRAGPVVLSRPEAPFTTGIQWAVASDGRVALVHPGDYHVELIGPNAARLAGKPIPFQRVRVSESHKQQWRDERKPPCGNRAISMPGGGGREVSVVPMEAPEAAQWPEFLPPLLAASTTFAPDGVLWVRRTVAGNAPPSYDLIDNSGIVVRKAILPGRTRLLGFGRGSVYLVRLDDDDLQYVQRHAFPGR